MIRHVSPVVLSTINRPKFSKLDQSAAGFGPKHSGHPLDKYQHTNYTVVELEEFSYRYITESKSLYGLVQRKTMFERQLW